MVDLRQKRGPSWSTVEAIISLNLWYLEDDFQHLVKITGMNLSANSLYAGLCFLDMQRRVSFSVLSQLCGVQKSVAEKVGDMFASMGLTRLVPEDDDGGEPIYALYIHEVLEILVADSRGGGTKGEVVQKIAASQM